jgi:hypothetical protein
MAPRVRFARPCHPFVARSFVRIPRLSRPVLEVELTPEINLLTRRLNPRCRAALCLKPNDFSH